MQYINGKYFTIMKNLFLSLAFMLVGSFAFANSEVTPDIDIDKIESLVNVDNLDFQTLEEDFGSCGFTVNFDDGTNGSGSWGGSGSFYFTPSGCDNASFWGDFWSMIDTFFSDWDAMYFN